MKGTSLRLAAPLLCLLAPAAPRAGTWINPYTGGVWNNPVSSQLDTMIRGRMLRDAAERDAARRREGEPAKRSDAPRPEAARVTYRPAASRTAEEFAASVVENPRDRAELARSLRQALASFRADAAKAGRKDDVAFALAFFIGGNFAVHAQRDLSDEALAAIAAQLDGALAAMPGLREASDARRQRLAEHLVCSTAFVLAGYQQGAEKKDDRQKELFRALAARSLETTIGIQAERLSVTDAGLEVTGSP